MGSRWLRRAVRALLWSYPELERRRYGDEIADTLVERVRTRRRVQGRARSAALASVECVGLVAAGFRMRSSKAPSFDPRTIPVRRRRKGGLMDHVLQDLRVALRGLARRPALTLLSAAALALGIGATVAVFSVFHAVLLRPLPFGDPERLVSIWETNPERGWDRAQVAAANFLDWRESVSSFEVVAAHNDWLDERVLVDGGEPVVVLASEVTGSFFDVLGVAPAEGRGFEDAHTWAGAESAVVLSGALARRHFGTGAAVVGRTVDLDGVPHRILGVMPEGFTYPFRDADIWVPVGWRPEDRQLPRFRRAHGMRVVGRLRQDASIEEAEAELASIAKRLEADYPETNTGMGTGVTPLREWIVGDTRRPLQIVMVAVAFVLFIACANVSNMLLARASGRRDELRIRSALGGGRRRLVLEGLLESFLLAGLGGAAGLALGVAALRPLVALSPEGLPRIDEVTLDASVVLFAIGVTLAAGLLFGILPAWRSSSLALSGGDRGSSRSRGARRASALLVVAEVALTLPLAVGAGLMVRTLAHLSGVEPGFDPEDVTVASVFLPSTRYEDDARQASFYRELYLRLRDLPGVEDAAMSSRLPFGNARWSSDFTVEGWPRDRFGINVRHDEITPGLFRTMEVPLLGGRDFDLGDDLDAAPVVIVNEALVDRYFPGEDPLGKRVTFDREPDETSVWRTIVGVVGNVRRDALSLEEEPSFYAPVLQETTGAMHVLVRSERDDRGLVDALRESLRAIDPALPLYDVKSFEDVVDASVARERFLLTLLALAAVVALLLASLGIFGVVLHSTTSQKREIGIRLALGARASSVVALVLRSGLAPVMAGIALGLAASSALARSMASLLFGVQPLDPATYAGVATVILFAGVAACAFPARWATRVDATSALRSE